MEKTVNKDKVFRIHIKLGAFCIAYSIGVALRLYVPALNSGEVKVSGFYWLMFYLIASYVIFQTMQSLIDIFPDISAPYMLMIGCCEGVSCVAICNAYIRLPLYSYTVGALMGGSFWPYHRIIYQSKG